MMAGKIVGLGLASLTQVAAWVAIGLVVYSMRGSLDISADISDVLFNPVFMLFFVVYLVLGYILFSIFFALIGSIVNSDKEAQSFVAPVSISLLLPVILAMYIVQEPDSLFSTIMSLIPIFTPTTMIMRMNIIGVESFSLANPMVLQGVIGVIITLLSIIFMTWATAKIFRIGVLMYGKRPTLPEIIKWIRYK
jgi:ABC-2 type transport system permease protein